MNGCVIAGTSIAVDFWQVHKHPGIRLFFLTHLHGDHIVGLTSSWRQPIYCSPLTAQLLVERYGINRCLLRPLEVGQTHLLGYCGSSCKQMHGGTIGVSGNGLDCHDGKKGEQEFSTSCESVTVSVIHAKHCPGAVMFLFEGSFGKILYTGDFRYSPSMLSEGSMLARHVGSIDTLYLDNTYCSPHCVFPSREEALKRIVGIIKEFEGHDVVFGIRSLGREELLARVALAVGEWVNVPPHVLAVASALAYPNVFRTGQPDLRLRVVTYGRMSCEFARRLNEKKPTIVILPTALFEGMPCRPFKNQSLIFVVPFSDHSSFPELVHFVSGLKPGRVVPIVRGKGRGPFGIDISGRQDMACFDPYLSPTKLSSTNSVSSVCLSGFTFTKEKGMDELENCLPKREPHVLLKKKRKAKWRLQKRRRRAVSQMGVKYLSDDDEIENEADFKAKKLDCLADSNRHEGGDKICVSELEGRVDNSDSATDK